LACKRLFFALPFLVYSNVHSDTVLKSKRFRQQNPSIVNTAKTLMNTIEWRISDTPQQYPEAISWMEERVAAVHQGLAPECIWLLEHPPLYTAGTSAKPEHLFNPSGLPVYQSGRGGQYTWHGAGQRIVYLMLKLKRTDNDVRQFVCKLEEWLIQALSILGVAGERRQGRIGIWVDTPQGECKIAALGIRVRHGIAFHGLSLNIDPDLNYFLGIVPCGIREFGVTSLARLGVGMDKAAVDRAIRQAFMQVFGEGT
jgi:lipoyl(octanoyl) transferase